LDTKAQQSLSKMDTKRTDDRRVLGMRVDIS
jgi:hypothetical protein